MTTATIVTNKGNVVLQLYDNETPNTVKNFVDLAKKGFYNGLKWHRVIADFMIQGGCPKGDGTGDPGYRIDCEIRPNLKHEPKVISMAHAGSCQHDKSTGNKISGKCSNGSQFFITHKATPWLDGVHTVFGKVTQGQNVVDAIQKGDAIIEVKIS
ncbi:MAG: peptidylprolyl isomerase [Promethearchaeota archaeon]|nr:MAG: peptidylprolyl isomerase [Candidatus Lokiarchaeota archaeon]